ILRGITTTVDSSTSFLESNPVDAGPLDQSGVDNYTLPVDLHTVGGGGTAKISGPVSFFDPAFFTAGFTAPGKVVFSIFQAQLSLPFLTVDPSARFSELPGGVAPILDGAGLGVVSLGTVNGQVVSFGGAGGPDFQFQQDGSQSFDLLAVPEPTTMALWSIGLGVVVF